MAVKGVSMPVVAASGVGALFVWSGIKGASVTGSLRDLLAGKQPSGADVNVIGEPAGSGGGVTGAGSGAVIAQDALQYKGHPYKYGGAPGIGGQQPWDCSSFVNWVVGHDVGMAIPGIGAGRYDGSSHGPPTGLWIVWTGCKTITKADIQAGDVMVWQTHMGIAISNTEMISALNASLGTRVTSIHGGAPGGEILVPRRLKALVQPATVPPGGKAIQGNRLTGKLLAGTYGWTGRQWTALDQLWTRESGWSNTAQNPSGAFGIPQALPYSKMPRAAWPASAGGSADPVTQINWGLKYIRQTYRNPAGAWAHEQSAGWY